MSANYRKVDSDFNRLYSTKNGSVEKKLNDWDKQTEESIKDSMKSHGVVDDSKRKMKSVLELVKKQRGAQGNLVAVQTLGELTAVLARQIEELKTIVALDSRATQSKAMEEKAIKRAAEEQEKHLMKDFAKPMKAKRLMTKFPSLGQGVEAKKYKDFKKNVKL